MLERFFGVTKTNQYTMPVPYCDRARCARANAVRRCEEAAKAAKAAQAAQAVREVTGVLRARLDAARVVQAAREVMLMNVEKRLRYICLFFDCDPAEVSYAPSHDPYATPQDEYEFFGSRIVEQIDALLRGDDIDLVYDVDSGVSLPELISTLEALVLKRFPEFRVCGTQK